MGRLVRFAEISLQQLTIIFSILYDPHACLTTFRHTSNETMDDVLGHLLLDLDRGITLIRNLVA